MQRPFIQCDVFTAQPTKGNALAVVLDGTGLSDDDMQAFAAWTNLAETTFLFPPSDANADYKVRIWTPSREMLFAGHPTLGSCASWLHAGGVPKETGVVRQECGVGIVEIDMHGEMPAFVAPPTDIKPMPEDQLQDLLNSMGLTAERIVRAAILDNGPVWQALELTSASDVLAIDSSRLPWPKYQSVGLFGQHPAGAECDYEVRMLAPSSGMSEDPITGSLNAALAVWKYSLNELTEPVKVAQGGCIDRLGRVYITPDHSQPGRILIGGQTHILIEGQVEL